MNTSMKTDNETEYELAMSLLDGYEGENDKKSIAILEKLANKGHVMSIAELASYFNEASMYENDKKLRLEKLVKSYNYSVKAPENAICQHILASHYRDGIEGLLEKDDRKALELYEKSSRQGSHCAQSLLIGMCVDTKDYCAGMLYALEFNEMKEFVREMRFALELSDTYTLTDLLQLIAQSVKNKMNK